MVPCLLLSRNMAGPELSGPVPLPPAPVRASAPTLLDDVSMSRLPDPPVPVAPWSPEVLRAVRSTPAPLFAVAYPATAGSGWWVSLLQGDDTVRDEFPAPDLEAADHELHRRGFLSMACAMGREWERLTAKRRERGRGTPVFRDPERDL